MTDPDDTPEGFSFPRSGRLAKAPPPERKAGPADGPAATLDDDDPARKAAATVASAPVDPGHGRPAGAGNALAFHAWKKAPPKSTSSE